MANNIYGDRLTTLAGRESAWFKLGGEHSYLREDTRTATEAFQQAGIDFTYARVQARLELPDGTVIPAGKKSAVVRSPTASDPSWQMLAMLDKGFEMIQPLDLAAMMEPLAERWRPISAAALGKGETVLLVLQAEGIEIAGDDVGRYIIISNGVDGTHGLRIMATHQRLVCTNMLEHAFGGAELRVSIAHGKNVRERAMYFSEVMSKLEIEAVRARGAFEQMARTHLVEEQALHVLEATYPMPTGGQAYQLGIEAAKKGVELSADARSTFERAQHEYELDRELAQAKRDGAWESYQRFSDEKPQVGETSWALLNAVSEASQVRWGRSPRSMAESELFGERRQERMRAARALALLTTDARQLARA